MTVTLRGVNLGFMGLDKSLLANKPDNVGVHYQCPAVEIKGGLDHGTWSVLCHMFPDADVPVVQLSINSGGT